MNGSRKWVDLFQVTSNQFFSLIDLKPNFFIIAYLRLACKKITVVFGLAEKHRKRTFSAEKKSHITKFKLTAKCISKSVNHLSRWKKWKKLYFTTTVEPGQSRTKNATRCSFCSGSIFVASRKFVAA